MQMCLTFLATVNLKRETEFMIVIPLHECFYRKKKKKPVLQILGFIGGLPSGSDDKESVCNAGDPGSIPGLGRCPGEGNGYPLQYSCLENSMDTEPGGLQSMGLQTVGQD